MNPVLLKILQHTIGLDEYGEGRQYRNHYVAGGDDVEHCRELSGMGFMVEHRATEISGGSAWFHVTPAGVDAVALHSPKRPPNTSTRSQRRYRDYLRSESNMSFGEWLKATSGRDRDMRYAA